MSILSVDQIQPIGSGTTITLNATEVKTGTEITVGTGASIFSPAGNTLTFGTNNVERLRISSNGHVAIGTDSPNSALPLTIAGQYPGIQFKDNQGTTDFNINADSAAFRIQSGTAGAGPSEKFRIGSSGQIGLGGANYGSSGQVLTSAGSGSAPTWSAIPAQVTIANNADNRVITGGSGVNLNGEAGLTYNGQALNVNSVTSENNAFRVYNTTTSATTFQINGEGNSFIGHTYPRSDANLDLGYHSGYRWRDVVLSGGIRFGSNSSDDYLDDYEEGSWTPSFTQGFSIQNYRSTYTKVGRLVTAYCYVRILGNFSANNNRFQIDGLPFNATNLSYYHGGGFIGYMKNSNYSYPLLPLIGGSTSYIYLHRQDGTNAAWTYADMHNIGNGYNGEFMVTVVYETAS